jgi:hypothetical protein
VPDVQAVLEKLRKGRGKGYKVTGRLLREPRVGKLLVIEFADGQHEYVTTPVTRVLTISPTVCYIETVNSRYRLTMMPDETSPLDDAS